MRKRHLHPLSRGQSHRCRSQLNKIFQSQLSGAHDTISAISVNRHLIPKNTPLSRSLAEVFGLD
ncbi:hypothetical protein THTE_2265 [Thermogutta terrifontis]|uniref:Uncharacterized protein n=1 Tax=Thermogutta terrifontis TaxID=1331910 RepID=A0A286RFY8_9BACT|nr:hypothetical protein THTE_2265 [Thermogutta terrifontis]